MTEEEIRKAIDAAYKTGFLEGIKIVSECVMKGVSEIEKAVGNPNEYSGDGGKK